MVIGLSPRSASSQSWMVGGKGIDMHARKKRRSVGGMMAAALTFSLLPQAPAYAHGTCTVTANTPFVGRPADATQNLVKGSGRYSCTSSHASVHILVYLQKKQNGTWWNWGTGTNHNHSATSVSGQVWGTCTRNVRKFRSLVVGYTQNPEGQTGHGPTPDEISPVAELSCSDGPDIPFEPPSGSIRT